MKRITQASLEAAPWVVTRRRAELKLLNRLLTKIRWAKRALERRGK